MNKNSLFIQSTIKQTYVIPVIKHFLSLYLTHTLHKSHERISMEELIFLLNMKIWINSDTSPSKPLYLICPHYVGLFYKMPTGFAGWCCYFQFFSPTSPATNGSKTLTAMSSQPGTFTEWSRRAKSFLFVFSLLCVRMCVHVLLADRPRSGGRGKVLHAAILLAVSFKCQSQCTPKFQLSCSIYSLCC